MEGGLGRLIIALLSGECKSNALACSQKPRNRTDWTANWLIDRPTFMPEMEASTETLSSWRVTSREEDSTVRNG